MDQISNKLKKIVFNKLYSDLSHTEIILYDKTGSIWIIDRENKYWYLEFEKSGKLWWRYQFFQEFFQIFSMERSEYEPIIGEWVEDVLNRKVVPPFQCVNTHTLSVEDVLNPKVVSPFCLGNSQRRMVEDVLNQKVVPPLDTSVIADNQVEEVLNSKVVSITWGNRSLTDEMDNILNIENVNVIP